MAADYGHFEDRSSAGRTRLPNDNVPAREAGHNSVEIS
jgi:hypothetical protein